MYQRCWCRWVGQGQQMQMALAPWLPFSEDKEFDNPY